MHSLNSEIIELVNTFISVCTRNQILAFSLYYGLNEKSINMTYAEIGILLGVSEATAKGYVKTALSKLSLPLFHPIMKVLKDENQHN